VLPDCCAVGELPTLTAVATPLDEGTELVDGSAGSPPMPQADKQVTNAKKMGGCSGIIFMSIPRFFKTGKH
jgi:hypothetical protein